VAKASSGRHPTDFTASAFDFTEARCRQAWDAVRDGSLATDSNNRRWWRDLGCKQLKLMATPLNAAFYRVGRVGTRTVFQRLGSLDDLRVADARRSCDGLRSDATLAAKVAPSRRRTGRLSVDDAWKAYYADAESGRFVVGRDRIQKSTLKSYEFVYKAHLKVHASRPLKWLAESFKELYQALGQDHPATANRFLQVVKNLFQHAAEAGHWTVMNPVVDPASGKPYRKYVVHDRERYMTTAEAKRLMAALAKEPEPWGDFFTLTLLTAARVGNVRTMRWDALDLHAGEWRIGKTKNGQPQVVPLVDEAVELLRARKQSAAVESEWVFPMRKDPSRHMEDVDQAWGRICEAAKLEDLRIHDLRRTAGSWATQEGAPMSAVGAALGHKSINSTKVYARADTRSARDVVSKVADRLRRAVAADPSDL
jgi:integrase